MNPYLTLSAELAGLVATIGAILFTVLFVRNPFAPKWAKSNFVAEAASLTIVGLGAAAIAFAARGLVGMGFGFLGASFVTIAVIVAASWLVWTATHFSERLRLAESGRSPFARLGRPHAGHVDAPTA